MALMREQRLIRNWAPQHDWRNDHGSDVWLRCEGGKRLLHVMGIATETVPPGAHVVNDFPFCTSLPLIRCANVNERTAWCSQCGIFLRCSSAWDAGEPHRTRHGYSTR